jgi:hypothetical protein
MPVITHNATSRHMLSRSPILLNALMKLNGSAALTQLRQPSPALHRAYRQCSNFARQCRLWVISGQVILGHNPTLSALVRKRTNAGAIGLSAMVESPGGISPPGAPRTVRKPLDSHGSRCSAIGTRGQQLCLIHELLLLPVGFSWPVVSAEQRSPFGPAPLQSLRP